MSTLNGDLSTFSVGEVLRLVGSSDRRGLLQLAGPAMVARIYLDDGTIAYATTRNEDPAIEVEQLDAARETDRRLLDISQVADALAEPTLQDLLRQQIVEVLSRSLRMTTGEFVFVDGNWPNLSATAAYPIDEALTAGTARLGEWQEIEATIGDLSQSFAMVAEIDEDRIEVEPGAWAILASLGEGASVRDLAQRLLVFEISVARRLAELVKRNLIHPVETAIGGSLKQASSELAPVVEADAPEAPADEDVEIWVKGLPEGTTEEGSEETPEEGPGESPGESPEEIRADEGAVDAKRSTDKKSAPDDDDDLEEPATELARRWRELSRQRSS